MAASSELIAVDEASRIMVQGLPQAARPNKPCSVVPGYALEWISGTVVSTPLAPAARGCPWVRLICPAAVNVRKITAIAEQSLAIEVIS
jgi:hypothetical protein